MLLKIIIKNNTLFLDFYYIITYNEAVNDFKEFRMHILSDAQYNFSKFYKSLKCSLLKSDKQYSI